MAVIIHNHVQVQARGHVSARAPIQAVRDHRDRAPVRVERSEERREDHDRFERPVIVRPVVYTPAPVYSSWTPAPSYTYQPSVIQVLAPTALANDQLAIDTGSLGNATTLELDAAGGSTYVSQVIVYSANGAAQVMPVNQMLSPQNPSIALSIDQCNAVSRIVVDGHSEWGGAISIRAL